LRQPANPGLRGKMAVKTVCVCMCFSGSAEVHCTVRTCKSKEAPIHCSSYRGIKLLDQAMNEMFLVHRIRQHIKTDDVKG